MIFAYETEFAFFLIQSFQVDPHAGIPGGRVVDAAIACNSLPAAMIAP
jgi:hypothetical protein